MATTGKYLSPKNQYFTRGICFGTFDPLHYGHIRLLRRAKKICDELYAVTECDSIIVEKHKPFSTEDQRVEDLCSIKYLSGVGLRTPDKDRAYWVRKFKADVLMVGDDHKGRWKEGEKLGLPIVYFPRTNNISSTELR